MILPGQKFFSQSHYFLRSFHYLITTLNFILVLAVIYTQFFYFKNIISRVGTDYQQIKDNQEVLKNNFADELFNEHLALQELSSLEQSKKQLEDDISKLRATDDGSLLFRVNEFYEMYQDYLSKLKRNSDVKLETGASSDKVAGWGPKLLNQEFEALKTEITSEGKVLDDAYAKYVAALPKPEPAAAGEGYTYITVSNERGKFGVHLIKVPLSSVRVKTVSANEETCKDNCPTKSLADYVSENNGYAGINGSYFCPPDYASCDGKVNSYDFALYNSNKGKWMSKDALGWEDTGLVTFNGSSASFYKESTEYGGGSVTAGISNYPSLVRDSEVIVNSGDLTSYQKDIKGLRGAIGFGGSNLYLAIINNATVIDAAYVMRDLGVKYALNLDGGGSSAMYINGKYMVGPGRSLPNAVVITK